MKFEEVSNRYDGPALEAKILAFWREHDVFHKILQLSADRPEFVWNDGPPTANGLPGIHHVLARSYKDIYPRFKTMRGYHAPRKAGWDTHGLPVEHEIEKELGIFDKKRIEDEVGIAEFNRLCRKSVMRYIGAWEKNTERLGFWVDMKDAYYTLDNSYIESVWYLLKVIWDKGLIYQDYKVVPYDPRIGATLSSHEVAQGYQDVDDPSIYVRFKVEGETDTSFLVWTTTPWTLPSNTALVVHPEVDYVFVETGGETLILAEALLDQALGAGDGTGKGTGKGAGKGTGGGAPPRKVARKVKGKALVGMRYERLFDYLPTNANICRVLAAEFVTIMDGTGIVHAAPAYGADDLELGRANGMPVLHGVGLDGYFKPEVTPVAGKFFKDADPILIGLLKERGQLFRSGTYRHNYPFGWRTGDPLIYYAKEAWYIRTSAIKERMVELNNTINWVPDTIREGRFGNWLENNVDWALSRERFWGTPLPVWSDGEGTQMCVGSLAELEALAGRSLDGLDLHRPAVDEITFIHPQTGREMRRVPEVIDCWFDSGAMSYAQYHFPFENEEIFKKRFPADYIVEAIDQTRGWFYTLHAIAVLVSDSVAFKNVICLSHVVDAEGKKMSKSQGNIVDPDAVFESAGADPLRWFFLVRSAPEAQKRISVDMVSDVAAGFLNTFWNVYSFFVTYANLDEVDLSARVSVAGRPEIDRWILALLHRTVEQVTAGLEGYDNKSAGEAIEAFVDQLSNWYIRRNRRRFWKSETGEDKQAAYLTLYESLTTLNMLIAPFMPMVADALHGNLVRRVNPNASISIHMEPWPEPDPAWANPELLSATEVVQKIVSLGRAARASSGHRVRQPLGRLLVRLPDETAAGAVEAHQQQILEELNVKTLEFIARDDELVGYRIKPNLPRLGKRHGKLIPAIRQACADADGAAVAASVAQGKHFSLPVGGKEMRFEAEDVLVETVSAEGYASAEEEGFLAALDTRLDEALIREGLARELVRSIQEARKQARLNISDRIALQVTGSKGVEAMLEQYRDYIMAETLAGRWGGEGAKPHFTVAHTLSDENWRIELSRLPS